MADPKFLRENDDGALVYDVNGEEFHVTPAGAIEYGLPPPTSALQRAADEQAAVRAEEQAALGQSFDASQWAPGAAHQTPAQPSDVGPFLRIDNPKTTAPAPTLKGGPASGAQAGEGSAEGTAPAAGNVTFYQPQAPAAPAGPQYATKTSTSTQRTKTLGIDEDLELMTDAAQRSEDAAQDVAEAEQRAATKAAAAQQVAIDATEKTKADIAERRQRGEQEVEQQLGKIDEAKALYKDAVAKGERSYFEDKSTGEHVGAAIAAMFGAMGAAFAGGPNYALQIIDRAMSRDEAKKRAKVADAKDILRGEYTSLDAIRTATHDDVTALLADRELVLEGVKEQVQQYAAQKGGEQALAIADQAIAHFDAQLAQNRAQMRDRVTTVHQSQRVPVAPAAAPDQIVPGYTIDRRVWDQLSDSDKTKAREGAAAFESALATVNEMKGIRRDVKTELFDSPEATRFANLASSAISDMARARAAGTIQQGEYDRFVALVGGSLKPKVADLQRLWGNDTVLNKLDAFEGSLRTSTIPRLRTYGLSRNEANLSTARPGAPE